MTYEETIKNYIEENNITYFDAEIAKKTTKGDKCALNH